MFRQAVRVLRRPAEDGRAQGISNHVENHGPYKYNPDINGYKQAVWDFMMEHCDVLGGGSFFVKFYVKDRRHFENRVIGRWKHNYHRGDPNERPMLSEKIRKELTEKREAKRDERDRRKAERRSDWRSKTRSVLIRLINKYL